MTPRQDEELSDLPSGIEMLIRRELRRRGMTAADFDRYYERLAIMLCDVPEDQPVRPVTTEAKIAAWESVLQTRLKGD